MIFIPLAFSQSGTEYETKQLYQAQHKIILICSSLIMPPDLFLTLLHNTTIGRGE